jgi:hypothetical protein
MNNHAISITVCLFGMFLLAGFASADESSKQDDPSKIELPEDRNAIVFEYDTTGGYRAALPANFQASPILRIYANGNVVTGVSQPGLVGSQGKLTAEELSGFMEFVVNKQRYFEISADKIQEQVNANGIQPKLMDGAVSKFRIQLKSDQHVVEYYALGYAASRFKTIPELQQLKAIETRARQLAAWTNLGSDEEAKLLLKEINTELHRQHPRVAGFSKDDFLFVTKHANGKLQVSLGKNLKEEGLPSAMMYARVVRETNAAKPEINIIVPPGLE